SIFGSGNNNTNAQSDAAIVRVYDSEKALAVTTDCNSRYVYANPYKGAMIAVAEAARNIVCSGGTPVGVTNCLNFGNPYNPEVYYQFVQAIQGMGAACNRFETPVTGGNVSFYNQGPDGAVYPTPTIGMVGVLDDINNKMSLRFQHPGDLIYVIGQNRNDFNCSEYLHHICGISQSPAPHFELDEEYAIQQAVAKVIERGTVRSAHDISEGGLFTCLLESAMDSGLGFDITTDAKIRKDAFLFGEGQSRVVVSVNPDLKALFEGELTVPFCQIGHVAASAAITIDQESWGYLDEWKKGYDEALEKLLTQVA
ncbi:MAG: phosphoribosylformylglycinamidine synthase subunit PurL, partial [Bacteroidetes bacterium]|nr:phosphoribosylformylglycinamidine synthase subunit PurL [Bacteroidota bacterium]